MNAVQLSTVCKDLQEHLLKLDSFQKLKPDEQVVALAATAQQKETLLNHAIKMEATKRFLEMSFTQQGNNS